MRWPEGPPHLALNPPYLSFPFFEVGGLFFLSFLCSEYKKLVFALEKVIFCFFWSLPLCFSLAFLGLPPFQFFFLCLSLSLSLVLFFFSSFLSFFFAFFCFLLVPCFFALYFLFFLLCFFFMKGTTAEHSIATCFSSIFSLVFGFLSCFCF